MWKDGARGGDLADCGGMMVAFMAPAMAPSGARLKRRRPPVVRGAGIVRCCSERTKVGYTLALEHSIGKIGEEEWDALLGAEDSPFLEHEWLRCVEQSGCAAEATGWVPSHVTIRDQKKQLVAACPLYLKMHSMGEFVFDQMWAEAAYRSGIQYYPKALCAIPFTPVKGRRLLTHPSGDRELLMGLLADSMRNILSRSNGISSMHINFCEDDEIAPLERVGFVRRKGVQYHFINEKENEDDILYKNFDEYLASMKSKRRIKVKRERRSIYEDAGLEVVAYFGDEIPDELFPKMFEIYKSTVDKFFYGIQHLNRSFFLMLKEKFRKNLCFIVVKRGGEIIAGTFNVVKAGRFYGRYWGTFDSRVRNLHFETCYYKPIEICLDRGLRRMEPGAGGDDFKFMRGFDATITNSMHLCRHPGLHDAVSNFLRSEGSAVENNVAELNERSVLRSRDNLSESAGDS